MANDRAVAAAERVWLRLTEMFGARFTEQFGAKPSQSWIEAIGELDHDRIKGALTRIRNSASAYPPTLPEFVAHAKGVRLQGAPAPGPTPEQLRAYGERLAKQAALVATMPKCPASGAVSNPYSTPAAHRAAYMAAWEQWEQVHGPAPWRPSGGQHATHH